MEKAVRINELIKIYEIPSNTKIIEYELHEIIVRMVLFFVSGFAMESLFVKYYL